MSGTSQKQSQPSIAIISIFMSNVPIAIARYQSLIVEKFLPKGATHYQILSRKSHGEQIDDCVKHFDHDIFVLLDIDAFPTSRKGLQYLIDISARGELCGNMQKSAHLGSEKLFAAPSFMSFSRTLFESLGKPSFCPNAANDVGEALSREAEYAGVPIRLLRPIRVTGKPLWHLDSDVPNCGPGTYFGYDTNIINYHQFEIRKAQSHRMFLREAMQMLDPEGMQVPMKFAKFGAPPSHVVRHLYRKFLCAIQRLAR